MTTAKIKKGAVSNAKLADGAVNFAKLATGTSVIASATGGPVAADQTGPVNVPLNPPLVLTPVAGQPITLNIEARASLTQKAASTCAVIPLPVVNGFPLLAGQLLELVSPDIPPESLFPNGIPQSAITLPVGLTQPGKPVTVTVEMIGDSANCKAGSTLDQVAIVAMQAK